MIILVDADIGLDIQFRMSLCEQNVSVQPLMWSMIEYMYIYRHDSNTKLFNLSMLVSHISGQKIVGKKCTQIIYKKQNACMTA